MSVGERILQFRVYLGLSQRGFAKEIGQHNSTVGNWEKDKSKPSVKSLARMQKLGMNINWLMTGKGKMFIIGPDGISVAPLSKIPKESFKNWLDEHWENVDDREREALSILFKRLFPDFNEWLKKRTLEADWDILIGAGQIERFCQSIIANELITCG